MRRIDVCLDCGQTVELQGRGLCPRCYQKARRRGDLPPRTYPTYPELLALSQRPDTGLCWPWRGSVDMAGTPVYGNGSAKYVARRVWLKAHGRRSVPKGKIVSHSCGNRLCINPEHLEVVDNGDNLRDIHAAHRLRRLRHAPA